MAEKKADTKVESKEEAKKETKKEPKTLIAKVIDAVSSIGPVTKDGKNNFSHYDYTTDGQVTACIRKLLEQGVWFVPNFEIIEKWKDGKNNFVQVQGHFTLKDMASDETLEGSMPGIGADTLDKAVYKAETGAKKNFFMQFLALTTEDDTDDDHGKGLENNHQSNQRPQYPQNNQRRNNNYQNANHQQQSSPRAPQSKLNMVNQLIASYANLKGENQLKIVQKSARKAHVNDLTQLNEPQVDEMINGFTKAVEMLNAEKAKEGAK